MSPISKTPQVIHHPRKLQSLLNEFKAQGRSIGFVPTMGALHLGHASLIEMAREQNDFVVVSIFVNPTQFNDPKDLERYPKTWEQDLHLAGQAGADFIFFPDARSMYPDDYRFKVTENSFSKALCGMDRPGHFDGVLTVVLKLLLATGAHRAYFGEKDFQQLTLIKQMAESFFIPTEIIGAPTVREISGLALSSRNQLLTPEEKALAPKLFEIICSEANLDKAKQQLEALGFKLQYLEEWQGRRFVAAYLGNVRLIDNVPI